MTQSVLFVCLGNICRSPLAEAALRTAAAEQNIALDIDSAGTGDWHINHAPDPRAQAVAKRHGVDISAYRARQITVSDFDRFDHIIALDSKNFADLRALQPTGSHAQLSLLLDHVPGREGQAVADPYYGPDSGFEITWVEVTEGAKGLLDMLKV